MAEKKLNDTLKTYRSIEHNVQRNPKTYRFFESRHLYQRILNSLELKKAQDQRAYDKSLKRYNNLQKPANPRILRLRRQPWSWRKRKRRKPSGIGSG